MGCFIEFSCVQQGLERTDEKTVAEGASVVSARFDLCPKWDGLTVYARFKHGAACYDVALDEDKAALIPWEVLKPTGFEVSVWGEDGEGGKLTSAVAFVDVARTVSLDAFEPIPSSPTLIGAFTEQVTAAAEAARIAQEANAATVEVGSVTTGAAGTDASVWNSGDNMNAVLNFAIPRGEKGEKGDGMPDGGEVGQIMTKTASGAVWADAPETGTRVDFPIRVSQGGTGATDVEAARANLDVYSKAEVDALGIGGGSGGGFSGLLPIENGGTGANTASGALENLGIEARLQVLEKPDGRVLWSGMAQMGASQTVTLSEAVSAQPNGVMLIFSRADSDTYFHCVPVSKEFVARHSGCSISVPLITNQLFTIKAVYVSDTSIMGDSRNESESFTLMDKTVSNKHQCLRYVIGY